ncbi:unnamed protein product [Caenorhabditis brenneri]
MFQNLIFAMSYQRNPFDFYNNRRRPSYSSTWEPAPSRADIVNRRDREAREAYGGYMARQPPRFSDSQHHQRLVRKFPDQNNSPKMPYHRDVNSYHHHQYPYETRRQAEYRNDRQNTHHYYGIGNDDYGNNNNRRQNYYPSHQKLERSVPEEDNRPRMPYHKDFHSYHQHQNPYGATPQVDHPRDGRSWGNDNPHNGNLHGDRDYRKSNGSLENRSQQYQYDLQNQNWGRPILPAPNMKHDQEEQPNYEQDYNYEYSSSNASRQEMNSEIHSSSELLGRADPSLDNPVQFEQQERSIPCEESIPEGDNTSEFDQEGEEEASSDQAAQVPTSNTTRIKEEVIDPEYEKSLNDLEINYEEIHAIFDTQRNIEPPWSRESPKWQEFMTAFRSGDTVRSEQLRLEIMAEDKKKKQTDRSATVGMDLTDGADEEDEEMDMEDSNNSPLNAQNILTQVELDAGFHEQMEIHNRLCDQNLLAEASSSGIEMEPKDVAASDEERTGRYSLRRAVKKTTKYEETVGRKGASKKEKSTAKPKRAKKQSQKNEVSLVEPRATRSRQTARDEPRKLRSRK